MLLKNLLFIALGGGAGSISRYLVQKFMYQWYPSSFPWGTLAANLAGCFLIGALYGLAEKGNILSPELRLLLITGFCGGFTTFSSFAYENTVLLREGDFVYLGLYIGGSVILGILATFLGIALLKIL